MTGASRDYIHGAVDYSSPADYASDTYRCVYGDDGGCCLFRKGWKNAEQLFRHGALLGINVALPEKFLTELNMIADTV
jgi:hypothetical protein